MRGLKKETWTVHVIAQCCDCGREFMNYKNAQELAAQHAIARKHLVRGEVGLAFKYDGRKP